MQSTAGGRGLSLETYSFSIFLGFVSKILSLRARVNMC